MPTRGDFSAKLKFSVYSGFLSSAVRCQPLSRALGF
ncbi:excinuclease, partial [Vibrio anguillarum]|nr:excinuclease [Vibrio anguillarum]